MKTQHIIKEQNSRLIKCKIRLTTRCGDTYVYYGLFKSTSDAIMDALSSFETATVFATAA